MFDESEDAEGIIESNTCATTIVRGVKRQSTVGRPRTRFKDPAERKKSKVHKKTSKAPTRRKITMQEFDSIGTTSELQPIIGHDVQPYGVLTQGHITPETNIQFPTSGNLDATTSWSENISFTQLLQVTRELRD